MSSRARQAAVGLGGIAAVLAVVVVLAATSAGTRGLRADVLSPRRAEPGEEIPISIALRDTKGMAGRLVVDFGDGRTATRRPGGSRCRPWAHQVDLRHRYEVAGVYTVRARAVTTGCGEEAERVTAVRTIEVKALRR